MPEGYAMPDQARAMVAALFLVLMAGELAFRWVTRRGGYDWRETATSLVIATINRLSTVVLGGVALAALLWLHRYSLVAFDTATPLALAVLFVLVDFAYYWHHRAMHRIRLLWANHSVHHSSTQMNLSAAVRLGLGGQILGLVFYAPLVLGGFHPFGVLGLLALNLALQFFVHSAWAPSLGPLEAVFNTPRHHHVHHACNPECLDRNFGGVFIVWDRLFGTFAAAPAEPLRFGLHGAHATSQNPFVILTREWLAMARDAWRARGVAARLHALIRIP